MVGNVGGDNLDVLTYGLLNKKVEEAKNVSGEKITEAVNTYLDENPVAPGATSEQAKQIQDNTNKITELKEDLVRLENILKDIQEKINSGQTVIDSVTVNEINDMIVEYFENKTVSEVEA